MRILWLAPYIPAPIFGGGTRIFNLINALAPTSDIDLIANGDTLDCPDESLASLRSLCRTVQLVPSVVSSHRRKRLLQLRSLVSRRPSQYWMRYSPDMQRSIDRALCEARYDVIILEHSFMGYYRVSDGTPKVLDQLNVENEILLRAGQYERSLVRRAYNVLEHRRYRMDEERICRIANLIFVTSERDGYILQRWSGLPSCFVVPNGVDTTYFSPQAVDVPELPASVVFTGAMHYGPNAEAMLSFVAETWPHILREVPEATLRIVGGAPPPQVLKLGLLPSVTVTGSVPDVRPYLASAQVIVAPLHIGGGTRLKILEALAMERATVSTSLGCEGLEVDDQRHLLVADDPAEFASKVVALLRDPSRRKTLAREGRRLVEDSYDWRAIGTSAAGALQQLVDSRAVPPAMPTVTQTPGC